MAVLAIALISIRYLDSGYFSLTLLSLAPESSVHWSNVYLYFESWGDVHALCETSVPSCAMWELFNDSILNSVTTEEVVSLLSVSVAMVFVYAALARDRVSAAGRHKGLSVVSSVSEQQITRSEKRGAQVPGGREYVDTSMVMPVDRATSFLSFSCQDQPCRGFPCSFSKPITRLLSSLFALSDTLATADSTSLTLLKLSLSLHLPISDILNSTHPVCILHLGYLSFVCLAVAPHSVPVGKMESLGI